tara:strand:+ start:1430 stop:1630 length:201 start_codon:yes stop_codon:yes gene_type:complete
MEISISNKHTIYLKNLAEVAGAIKAMEQVVPGNFEVFEVWSKEIIRFNEPAIQLDFIIERVTQSYS